MLIENNNGTFVLNNGTIMFLNADVRAIVYN